MRLLLLSIMMLVGTSAWALNKNPWMRTCRIDQGQFWVIQSEKEDLALCLFGNFGVGAESLFLFKTKAGIPQALQAYWSRNVSSNLGSVCSTYGAQLIRGIDTDGKTFNVCRFSDQSLIEETTLWFGPGTAGSEGLDKALSATY